MQVYNIKYAISFIKDVEEENDNLIYNEYDYVSHKSFRTVIPRHVSNQFFMGDTFDFKYKIVEARKDAVKLGIIDEYTDSKTWKYTISFVDEKPINASMKTIKQTVAKDIIRIVEELLISKSDMINCKDSFFEFCDKNNLDYFEDYEVYVLYDILKISKYYKQQIKENGLYIGLLPEEFDSKLFALSLDAVNYELEYINTYITNFICADEMLIYILLFPNAAINTHRFANSPHLNY